MHARIRRRVALLVVVLVWSGAVTGQDKDKPRALGALLASYHEAGLFNGSALVAEQGQVILKNGFGYADFEWKIPNTPDTKFRLGSITKQFTATLVLQLIEEGKLSLDTTLVTALPYYRKDTGGKITIHHLLTHTSGIPSYTGLPNFSAEVSRNPYGVREFVEKYCSGDLEFEPGARFRYNNSGYFLLGAIVEQLTGKTYERALKERIFGPLGMTASGYDRSGPLLEKRARGYARAVAGVRNAEYLDMSLPYAAGSLYSTVEDLYLWDQALYGEKLLPERAKQRMFSPGLENYGFGWVIRKERIGVGGAERLTISHGGGINGFNTLIVRVPDERSLVVLLNNTGGTNLQAMYQGIMDVLHGRTPPPPKRPVATALYETIDKNGMAAALAQYRDIRKSRAAEFDLAEVQLVRLGTELLQEKRTVEAIEVFKLNLEPFPASVPTYNGLADAYIEAGQTPLAIKALEKIIELDPANRRAKERLNELVKRQ